MGKIKITLGISFFFFLIVFGIVVTNYRPQTFLSGWDNLHSEFSFAIHFMRAISAVWQEHQGMGTVMSATYALDAPRLLYLWILSLVFPTDMLRYLFHFSMLFVGTLGTYLAIKSFFIDREGRIKYTASIFGALFYLLNLGTVQYFATPFEPFSVFWGIFPWLIYGTLSYLHRQTPKTLIAFALINLIATPMFYVPTVFYVYILVLFFLFVNKIIYQPTKQTLKIILAATLVFFIINAFWILPHAYWFLTNRAVQQSAIINKMTTDETYQTVQQFGNLPDFMLLKNKPWDYLDFEANTQQFLLQPWHDYFNHPIIPSLGYVFFGIVLLGIFTIKKNRQFVIGTFILCFIILANQVPVAKEFNQLFRQISIVNQVFRDPFTKFIVPTMFVFAVGFSAGISLLFKLIPTKLVKPVSILGTCLITTLLIIYMFPVFTGHLFADRMRVVIPKYYFDFFSYMREQDPTKRVANLPQEPIWGWTSYKWGYTGSGFLWHGFNQSILDRTFDVWNDKNEEYYWELVYALNKSDYDLFNAVLRKYNIAYVMFDSAIYFPDNPNSVFGILRQKQFIEKDPDLKKVKSFGTIDLYATNISNNKYVSVIDNVTNINTSSNWLQQDQAYLDYGDYVVDNKNSQVNYPFRSLFSGRGSSDITYQVTATTGAFFINNAVPSGQIIYPQEDSAEFISFDVKNLKATKNIPQVINNGKSVAIATGSAIAKGNLGIVVDRDKRYGSYDSNQEPNFLGQRIDCDDKKKNVSQEVKNDSGNEFIEFKSIDARTCRVIYLPQFDHKSSYLVAVKSRNRAGSTLHFWIENLTSKRSDQLVYLKKQDSFIWEYFIVPPMETDGVGYSLHLDNVAIGKQQSINDLSQVVVNPIPYNFLTKMKIITDGNPTVSTINSESMVNVEHNNSYSYTININPKMISNNSTLAVYQSYDSGWKAYVIKNNNIFSDLFPFIGNLELKNHVLVNNWANGWKIGTLNSDQARIVIVFWPQYLEFAGFLLLPIPFIYAFWLRKKVG